MSRLPRLAVVIDAGSGPGAPPPGAGTAALIALVDGGLDGIGVIAGDPSSPPAREAARTLGEFGMADRLTIVPGPLVLRTGPDGGRPFALDISDPAGVGASGADPASVGTSGAAPAGTAPAGVGLADVGLGLARQDAVVFVGAPPPAVPPAGDEGEPGQVSAPRSWSEEYFFAGVFHQEVEGLYRVSAEPELAAAQGRWIGEYLRGRYLLPSRPAMVSASGRSAGGPPADRAGQLRRRLYLRALTREVRRGHARAASAGYPLPVPAHRD
ncbi:hypothetical protein [Frankia sp. EAN1pec]|uniref:hypothetical protein n=1 Tax=Parafrankia sp. (strain EAN1pec) TaxID=298653 RepID=UPI00059D13D6